MLKRKLFTTLIAVSSMKCIVDAQEPVSSQPAAVVAKKLDSTSSGVGVRASKLIGMTIHNSQKENIGQIKDVVLDPLSTRIQYVAVSYGGFLGLGNKLFAVPMHAIKVQANPDHKDQIILVMDVSKEQMNGATGFDEEHWPDFSDTNFVTALHQRYRVTKASSEMNLTIRERGQAMKGFVQDIESLTVKNKDFRHQRCSDGDTSGLRGHRPSWGEAQYRQHWERCPETLYDLLAAKSSGWGCTSYSC